MILPFCMCVLTDINIATIIYANMQEAHEESEDSRQDETSRAYDTDINW
jgi:hypothetical protein